MSKKIFLSFLVLMLLLGACDLVETPVAATEAVQLEPSETPPAPTETLPPTDLPTETPAGTFTPTPTSVPPTPSQTPLPPENADDCVNAGKFIDDVTIPDNSDVNINQVITKTWRVQNVGTCTWWYGYTVDHYTEFDFGVIEPVPLPLTAPGQTADISVDLLVPNFAGLYRGNFVIKNPDGLPIEIEGDSRLWVIFNAVDDGSTPPTATTAPTQEGAEATATPAAEATAETATTAACEYTPDAIRVQQLLDQINAYRAQSGLPAYTFNAALTTAAQNHAADMACNRTFTHNGSDGSTAQTRATAAGYTGTIAENVYGSYPAFTAKEVTDWWRQDKTDPNNNANLTSTTFTEVGVGYAFFGKFGFYTVVFGAP